MTPAFWNRESSLALGETNREFGSGPWVLRIPRSPLQSRQHSREATRTNEPRHGCSQRSDSNCPGTFRGRATIGDLLCKTKRRAEGLGESLERRQLAPYNSESHFDFGEGLLTAEHTFDHGVGEMNWARSLDPSRRKEREQLSNAWVMKKHAKTVVSGITAPRSYPGVAWHP